MPRIFGVLSLLCAQAAAFRLGQVGRQPGAVSASASEAVVDSSQAA